jgi:hypothetical protein
MNLVQSDFEDIADLMAFKFKLVNITALTPSILTTLDDESLCMTLRGKKTGSSRIL